MANWKVKKAKKGQYLNFFQCVSLAILTCEIFFYLMLLYFLG